MPADPLIKTWLKNSYSLNGLSDSIRLTDFPSHIWSVYDTVYYGKKSYVSACPLYKELQPPCN